MQMILTTDHLTKQIGAETIVSDLNMHIAKERFIVFSYEWKHRRLDFKGKYNSSL